MKVNVSIHDFSPLLRDHEFLFRNLKATGVDGVELVVGVKSRWAVQYYKKLAKKYNLPIVSLHQPPWSGLGLFFDEGFFDMAKEFNVTCVTCHPLPNASMTSKRMRNYLKKLSQIKRNTGLEILIENMPNSYKLTFFEKVFPLDITTSDVTHMVNIIAEYGLNMTLDVDHLQSISPQNEPYFSTIYPKISNIHLSSFDSKRRHLPVYIGNFHTVEFLQFLRKEKYKGLLTFEINYSGLITLFDYNFDVIKKIC